MHQKGKIAGMGIRVGHSTTVMNMLVEEIMFAVLLEVLTCSVVSVIYTNGCKQQPPSTLPLLRFGYECNPTIGCYTIHSCQIYLSIVFFVPLRPLFA